MEKKETEKTEASEKTRKTRKRSKSVIQCSIMLKNGETKSYVLKSKNIKDAKDEIQELLSSEGLNVDGAECRIAQVQPLFAGKLKMTRKIDFI